MTTQLAEDRISRVPAGISKANSKWLPYPTFWMGRRLCFHFRTFWVRFLDDLASLNWLFCLLSWFWRWLFFDNLFHTLTTSAHSEAAIENSIRWWMEKHRWALLKTINCHHKIKKAPALGHSRSKDLTVIRILKETEQMKRDIFWNVNSKQGPNLARIFKLTHVMAKIRTQYLWMIPWRMKPRNA